MLAKRILILGPCGAGKSTLARLIGKRLGLPVVHLDRFFWNPGWVQTEHSTFRNRVTEAAGGGAWVMDGNYTDSLDVRLPRADAVIWLDFPRRIYFPRVLCRIAKGYGRAREDLGPGCPERIDLPFMRWVWTYPTRRPEHEEIVANLPAGIRGIILRSPAEVANFADGLPSALTVAPERVARNEPCSIRATRSPPPCRPDNALSLVDETRDDIVPGDPGQPPEARHPRQKRESLSK